MSFFSLVDEISPKFALGTNSLVDFVQQQQVVGYFLCLGHLNCYLVDMELRQHELRPLVLDMAGSTIFNGIALVNYFYDRMIHLPCTGNGE